MFVVNLTRLLRPDFALRISFQKAWLGKFHICKGWRSSFSRESPGTLTQTILSMKLLSMKFGRTPSSLIEKPVTFSQLPLKEQPVTCLSFILYFADTMNTILYHNILYYTILYYTILYYNILYYTILYYTILYYTII